MYKELNWIEAAQAIEEGKEVQFLRTEENAWYDSGTVVRKGNRYRIKPREFTQGWYEYDTGNTTLEGAYKSIVFYSGSCWQTVQNFKVLPHLVGKKIK